MTDLFTNEPEFDQNKNWLEELVGEGKKFKSAEDLAKGKAHADSTILTLTQKLDELRSDYMKVAEENKATAKLQELIDRLENRTDNISANTSEAHEDKSGLKLEDIDTRFFENLSKYEQTKKETENFTIFENKLKERHGDNARKYLSEQMQTLGLDKDTVMSMAKKQPQVLIKALGLDAKPQDSFNPPPRSDRRNDNFAPTSGQKRTWSYYQEMRKKDPTLYHDPKINIQMQKDMFELGEAFMDGDFHD